MADEEYGVKNRKGNNFSKVPSTVLLLVFGVYMLLGYLTQLVEDEMPRPIKDVDIPIDVSDQFSEEAALQYLHEIIGDQPRVAGTKYHLQKTEDLKKLVDSIAAQGSLPVHTEWQMVSGDFLIEFSSSPQISRYANISNIVAVLEGESGFHSNGSIGTSVLLNCHYDSVPFALGASDNALFCAIMVETLKRLSRRQTKLKHNVVFLFNGAEEQGLQAAHGFLKHEWSKNIVGVINLDASGMNGKANLFQVTDIRLLKSYQRTAKRPSLQSVGEFLFSTGIIPSDTDFRIWRDFGNIYGIDIAFVKWGSVYHTRYDHPDLIKTGVTQAAGEMLLGLTTDVADLQDLQDQTESTTAVYYDYLNWFVVVYSKTTATVVDVLMSLAGLATVALYLWMVGFNKSNYTELSWAVVSRIASGAAGVVLAFTVTIVMSAISGHLKYLAQPWIVVAQSWIPLFVGSIAVSHLFDSWRCKKLTLNRSLRVFQAQTATRTVMSVVLLTLSMVPALASARYQLAVPLFLASLMAVVSMTIYRYFRLKAYQHLLLECLLSLPSVLFIFAVSLRLDALMLPVMGRSPLASPDWLVCGLNVAVALLAACAVSGVELLVSRRRLWLVLAAALVAALITLSVPIFPYQDDGPSTQRHYWFHGEVRSYNYSNVQTEHHTGVLVTKYDKYTHTYVLPSLLEKGINVNVKTDFAEDCQKYVHCNMPLYRPRFQSALEQSVLLYTGGPRWDSNPTLELTSRRCVGEVCTLSFKQTGPANNLLTFKPLADVNITAWSLASPLRASFTHAARPVYQVVHVEGNYKEEPMVDEFSLQLLVPLSLQNGPVLDVAHHAHRIQHPEDFTVEYRSMLDAMPKYFNIATFISMRTNYEF